MTHLLSLYRYRDLLWLWIGREIQVRYKQSLLGIVWAILQPLALALVFTWVFSQVIRVDTGDVPYIIFSYTTLVPWTFFTTSISFGVPSLVNNMSLVGKIYFPREVLPLASIGAALLDYFVGSLILAGMLLVYHIWPGIYMLWVVPLLALQIILTMGVALFGASIIVFFRDVRFVMPLVTQVWMYATPVVYPTDMVPERLQPYYFLNPMAGIIDGYRRVLIMGEPPRLAAMVPGMVISLLIFVAGYILFKRVEPLFADLI
jgi:lipopolysaccharide transport system permease protein